MRRLSSEKSKTFNVGEKHICTLDFTGAKRQRITCYQKLLGFFEDSILISEKNPRAMLYFRSYTAIQTEKLRQINSKHNIIHPFSEFRRYFEYLMTWVFLVVLVVTPWDMYCDAMYAAELEIGSHIYLMVAFLLNAADIMATFYTGYQDEKTDEVVIDVKRMHRHYVRSWLFLWDLIATAPLELVITHLPYSHAYHIRWVNILSITRLFRIPTTIIYMNNIADLWQVNPALYRSLRYLVYSILILHWTTCVAAVISQYFYIYNLGRTQQNWVAAAVIRPGANKVRVYISAMFRTAGQLMGVTHGIFPNLTMEDKLVTVAIFMSGHILMGFLLILTLQLMMSQAGPQLMNLAFLNQLQMYMSRIRLPPAKQTKLVTYYKYLFRENSFYDSETLKLLSDQLRHEIIMHTYRNLVRNITIMAEFPQESVDIMLKYLRREIYMPGDYVMRAGIRGNCMYFIVNGTVAVTTHSGIELSHLHDGAYFGEIALLTEESRRTTNVIALEISEICRLDRQHFQISVARDSLAYQHLVEQALERQKRLEELSAIHFSLLRSRSRANVSVTPSPFSNFGGPSTKSFQSYTQSL